MGLKNKNLNISVEEKEPIISNVVLLQNMFMEFLQEYITKHMITALLKHVTLLKKINIDFKSNNYCERK